MAALPFANPQVGDSTTKLPVISGGLDKVMAAVVLQPWASEIVKLLVPEYTNGKIVCPL
jgi:hypothetical protein